MAIITLPSPVPMQHCAFSRDNAQELQPYISGAAQITSYQSRKWLLNFSTPPLFDDELEAWSLCLNQLADLSNTFLFTPPEYSGPSLGYSGVNPAVKGAAQTGTSLICDGVSASKAIVGAGDYASFSVTTAKGNTNYELHRIKSLATSDASGNVTLSFTRPIRQAPADNAVVQIFAPVAQFRLTKSQAGTDLQVPKNASLVIDAEEAIWL